MWKQIKLALTRKTKLARPIQLILFITDRCNARCIHCFNWRALNQGDDGLTLEELQRLSGELGPLLTLGISGGEPFLRQDIAAVFRLFAGDNGLRDIAIPTNGLMPARIAAHVRDMLDQDSPTRVTISLSLDGLPDLHDHIRGVPGNFPGYSRLTTHWWRSKKSTHIALLTSRWEPLCATRTSAKSPN